MGSSSGTFDRGQFSNRSFVWGYCFTLKWHFSFERYPPHLFISSPCYCNSNGVQDLILRGFSVFLWESVVSVSLSHFHILLQSHEIRQFYQVGKGNSTLDICYVRVILPLIKQEEGDMGKGGDEKRDEVRTGRQTQSACKCLAKQASDLWRVRCATTNKQWEGFKRPCFTQLCTSRGQRRCGGRAGTLRPDITAEMCFCMHLCWSASPRLDNVQHGQTTGHLGSWNRPLSVRPWLDFPWRKMLFPFLIALPVNFNSVFCLQVFDKDQTFR